MNKASRPSKAAAASKEVRGQAPGLSEEGAGSAPQSPATAPRFTGVYVDVENLRANAQQIVKTLVENWPAIAPPLGMLCLYVRADFVELWRLWATSQFRNVQVVVKGVQHFSTHASKNSADIAIATDAISDLLSKRVGHLAVLSDDSDFIALYAAVRDQTLRQDPRAQQVPFLWIITDRSDTLSGTVRQYFPREAIHVVPVLDVAPSPLIGPGEIPPDEPPSARPDVPFVDGSPGLQGTDERELMEDIAAAIVQKVPAGPFKSIDCQQVIRRYWPEHPLATASGPHFGQEFLKRIWPILEQRGARAVNPGQTPRRYEMTEEAKAQPLLQT